MYDVLYSNTIQKCPLILYWIYQLQHSVSLHLTASFMKHRLRVRCTSINSLNVLMNSSSHASLMYTNRQSSSRKSRHQKNRNRNIQVNTIVDIMIVHTLGFLFPWGGARGHDRLYKGLWTLRWALRLTSTLLGNMITVYPRPEEVSSINDKSSPPASFTCLLHTAIRKHPNPKKHWHPNQYCYDWWHSKLGFCQSNMK